MESDSPTPKRSLLSILFSRIFSGRPRRARTGEELQELIEESEANGILNEEEGEMLHSILEFGDMIVRQVMVTRTDMVICPITANLSRLLELINSSGHSRIPIFEGSTDGIVGIVYAKDLLRFWGANDDTLTIAAVMRPPFYVPETKAVEDLLQDFRNKRVHMAIVIDEYGGTSGLVTIEDLLEEIVGDIQDEFDREEDWLIVEDNGGVLVDGRLNIADLEEHFDLEIPRDKFDTVGGYLVNLNGQVPACGACFTDSGLTLEVLAADQRKVSRVRIRRAATSPNVESYE